MVLLPILCFLGRFKWPMWPLLSMLGLFFMLSIYTFQHPIQHNLFRSPLVLPFLSITIFSIVSLLPGNMCPIHFLFLCLLVACIKALSSPIPSITSLFALYSVWLSFLCSSS